MSETAFRPNHCDPASDLPADFNDLEPDDRASMLRERERLLHIRGQGSWHDNVRIVGNRNGLLVLRAAIDDALQTGAGATTAMVCDGEGFGITVALNEASWDSPAWEAAEMPYSDPVARGEPDPWSAVTLLRAALRQANAALFARGGKPVVDPTEG